MSKIKKISSEKLGSISTLNKHHNRTDFDCGEKQLNDYLKNYANQHAKQHISKTFIFSPIDRGKEVLGFYTLSAGHITFDKLPVALQKKFPRYPIPIARIGRLAVHRKAQGKGIGEYLLMDAFYRCVSLTKEIGLMGVVVDAKHIYAKAFYEKYGFVDLTHSPMTLFLPIKNIIDAMTE